MSKTLLVPDLGVDKAEVIEILVKPGDKVEKDQGLVTVESDKASMEIPALEAGVVEKLLAKVGDQIISGQELAVIKAAAEVDDKTQKPAAAISPTATEAKDNLASETSSSAQVSSEKVNILVPDLGVDSASVIEILAQAGDSISNEQGLVLVESDKASMEIPSPHNGTLVSLAVKVGDAIISNQVLGVMQTTAASKQQTATTQASSEKSTPEKSTATKSPDLPPTSPSKPVSPEQLATKQHAQSQQEPIYAGPAVRKLSRHLGVDLSQVKATGANGRILKEDLHSFVRNALKGGAALPTSAGSSNYVSARAGNIDFSQFGEISIEPMERLHQLTADSMAKASAVVPQVTQFDNADITELEAFRKSMQKDAEKQKVKLTLLAFLVMASAKALRKLPQVNVSIDQHQIIKKNYCNIGVAVDTPHGLMVPVIKDADTKGLYQLAGEIIELASKARKKTLKPAEMQGGCFTISSLGGIGGTNFTPIVNHPEVAILGVSKSTMQPVWNDKDFTPRLVCPLALSYDHRAINGADGARFLRFIADGLEDSRKLLI